jgi:hypothetical protein
MCWSGEASTVLAAVGLGSTVYVASRGEDKRLWMTLGYFSLMEVLQAYTYTVIDDCSNPANQVATLLGYLHIVFQPFFANLISLYFIPKVVRDRIEIWVYSIVSVGAVCMLVSVYPFDWAPTCETGIHIFCSQQICSISGDWHIAWEIPRRLILLSIYPYILTTFVLPILYGSWRMTIYHLITGPALAYLTTGNWNEFAAVWCLYSIALLLIVIKTPLRKMLFVNDWFFYSYFFKSHKNIKKEVPVFQNIN